MQYTYELENGLIFICGSDQNWVSFMLLGMLGFFKDSNFRVISKNNPKEDYYFKHLTDKQILKTNSKEVHYFGAIKDLEKLEQTLDSAKKI